MAEKKEDKKRHREDEEAGHVVKKAKNQKKAPRVAFQGLAGSYSEQAAFKFFKNEEVVTIGARTFEDVIQQVQSGACDSGLVPIENSDTGSFKRVYDLLTHSELLITGECAFQDDHCLCALPDAKREDIRKIYSHPEALEQCRKYVDKLQETNGAAIERFGVWNTAAACQLLQREGWRDSATIASRRAAEIYKLKVLETNLGSDVKRATRYVVLGKIPPTLPVDARHKSTIVVTLRNEMGALFKCVSCFALRGISILKLETRPDTAGKAMYEEQQHWSYSFYIDFEPSRNEQVNRALMTNLREFCQSVRELGVYAQNSARPEFVYSISGAMM